MIGLVSLFLDLAGALTNIFDSIAKFGLCMSEQNPYYCIESLSKFIQAIFKLIVVN